MLPAMKLNQKLMARLFSFSTLALAGRLGAFSAGAAEVQEPLPAACIRGVEAGWRALTKEDFVNVNCDPDTWSWRDGRIHCSGKPIGVIRTRQVLTNFELVVQWRHLREGGNSGVFVWASPESIRRLEAGKGRLPEGIEVQILAIPAGFAQRQAELSVQEPHQGRRTMEPLLRALHQRGGALVGERRRGVGRNELPAGRRLSLPGVRRCAHRFQEPAHPRVAVGGRLPPPTSFSRRGPAGICFRRSV